MKKDKPSMGAIVEAILGKKKPKQEEKESNGVGMEDEGMPRQAIAQDLIDALRSGNPDGVIAALDAFSDASSSGYASSHREDSKEMEYGAEGSSDCGCNK